MRKYDEIALNTSLAEELFNEEFLSSIILHIPHSSTHIPKEYLGSYTNINMVQQEMELLTDHATHQIFDFKGITQLIFPYNRIFCDIERLPDEQEEMFPVGRGFYYTQTDSGEILRSQNHKKIVEKIYIQYHEHFTKLVDEKIKQQGFALIIDCHSFANTPFKTDLNQDAQRPDFCIGTDDFHTPIYLTKKIQNQLINLGYSVKINNPYAGTIVPLKFYKNNANVQSVMIEINRNLYMENNQIIPDKVKLINQQLQDILF